MSTQDRFQIISFDILWSSDKSYDNVVETFDFHDPPLQLMRWVELSIVSFMTCSRAEALPLSRNQVRKGVDSRVTLLIVLFGILPLIAIWNKLVRGYYVLRAQFNRGYLKWHSSSNRGWMDENAETLYGKMRGIRLPLGGPASLSLPRSASSLIGSPICLGRSSHGNTDRLQSPPSPLGQLIIRRLGWATATAAAAEEGHRLAMMMIIIMHRQQ